MKSEEQKKKKLNESITLFIGFAELKVLSFFILHLKLSEYPQL